MGLCGPRKEEVGNGQRRNVVTQGGCVLVCITRCQLVRLSGEHILSPNMFCMKLQKGMLAACIVSLSVRMSPGRGVQTE